MSFPISDVQNPPPFTYDSAGTYTVSVILGSDDGCEFVLDTTITVAETRAAFTVVDSVVCLGDPVVFTNISTSAVSFTWDFDDGSPTSSDVSPTYTYTQSDTFNVTLVAEGGGTTVCRDTADQTIIVRALPAGMIDDTGICGEGVATFTIEGADQTASYFWAPVDIFDPSSIGEPSISTIPLTSDTTVTLEVVDTAGCITRDTATISVVPLIELASDTFAICPDVPTQRFLLQENEFYNYTYTATDGGDYTSMIDSGIIATVTIMEGQGLTINVEASDIFGLNCLTPPNNRAAFIFDADRLPFFIPNAFTPDGDQINDFFNVIPEDDDGNVDMTRFQIFNRWGSVVYDNEQPDQGWDGKINGKPSPSDVYIYIMEFDLDGCNQIRKGDVMLIR